MMSDITEFFRRAEWASDQSADEADALNAEIERLRAQVATLTETIEAAQQALSGAPAWHQGIRDAIDTLKNYEVKK
jgi:prefoldin subunit 5